jgi:L,D-peptidoglycan transpeptidase YkuD (ErfK/YbiS/YcfS/YnhG family)
MMIWKCLLWSNASFFIIICTLSCNQKAPTGGSVNSIHEDKTFQSALSELPSKQIIIAQSFKASRTTGILFGLSSIGDKWNLTYDTIDCVFGKEGMISPNNKKEGDLKTPSGQYLLGPVFGYKKNIKSALEFIELTENHYWIDDIHSSLYNQLVCEISPNVSGEKMKRKDKLYKYGINIQYNANPIIKGKGSAIFLHIWRNSNTPTLGCIAISENNIKDLIEWVKVDSCTILIGNAEDSRFISVLNNFL